MRYKISLGTGNMMRSISISIYIYIYIYIAVSEVYPKKVVEYGVGYKIIAYFRFQMLETM